MRFLKRDKVEKTVVVISDIHLGAGHYIGHQRNFLEDFHNDDELVEFLKYYSTGDYQNREVELIINGDFFDLLAVPFVPYFDDEFWSEEAALEKLKMIFDAHPEVMTAMVDFLQEKRKKIVFIIGNHDAELVFPELQKLLIEQFPEEIRDRFILIDDLEKGYVPVDGVMLTHGHEYEIAHQFDPKEAVVEDTDGKRYFIPPWGSYYVTRVINKFKEDRDHVNAVRPIKKFLIHGLIYDTLFTIRFLFANAFYFIMVRSIYLFKHTRNLREWFKLAMSELELFEDYEQMTKEFFVENPEYHTLIVGHTHEPIYRSYVDGTTFINTGTWTRMYHLDFKQRMNTTLLSYALVESGKGFTRSSLQIWKGKSELPYEEY